MGCGGKARPLVDGLPDATGRQHRVKEARVGRQQWLVASLGLGICAGGCVVHGGELLLRDRWAYSCKTVGQQTANTNFLVMCFIGSY